VLGSNKPHVARDAIVEIAHTEYGCQRTKTFVRGEMCVARNTGQTSPPKPRVTVPAGTHVVRLLPSGIFRLVLLPKSTAAKLFFPSGAAS
jgi:hypothetical protein